MRALTNTIAVFESERDRACRYGADGREFVFKTNSGNVLHLAAQHQNRLKHNQHENVDDEDELFDLPSTTGPSARDVPTLGSSIRAAPAMVRSASFHPQNPERLLGANAARLERSATVQHMADPNESDQHGLFTRASDFTDEELLGRDGGSERDDAHDGDASDAGAGTRDVATNDATAAQESGRMDVDADDSIEFLMSHVPAFAQLQPHVVDKVLQSARAFVLDAGSVLVKENETASGNSIWIVLKGMLQVTRTAVKFASAQQQLVQRVIRKKACIDPAPLPPDAARLFHTGITVR